MTKTETVTSEVIYRCAQCGAETEWDMDLGGMPLCMKCWDTASEKHIHDLFSAAQRRWYAEHKEEVAAAQRRYRLEHPEEVGSL